MADPAHEQTEKLLEEIERRVRREYLRAYEETEDKLADYLRRFEAKDRMHAEAVRRGEETEEEYRRWRKGQILVGRRWREMADTLAEDYRNADRVAASIVNEHTPEVYALNHDYATFQVERGSRVDTSYTLYDRATVERLLRDQPDLLPAAKVDGAKDLAWNRRHVVSAVTQGILQGESLPKVAQRLRTVAGMDFRASMRTARTTMTSAQNAGRTDAYRRAQGMGIQVRKQWLATLDRRTRHSHRRLDGEVVGLDEQFSNGLRYPGDPSGAGSEVYNCRCTLVPDLPGVDDVPRNSKLGDMSYEEWKSYGKRGEKTSWVRNTVEYKKVTITPDDWEMWAVDPEPFQDALLHGKRTSSAGWGKVTEEEQDRILLVAQQMQVSSSMQKHKDIVTTYRGESYSTKEEAMSVYKTGSTVVNRKLTSQATERSVAEEYASSGLPVRVIQVITNRGGTRGAISDPMGIGGSSEIVSPAGSSYKVTGTSWDEESNTLIVYLFAEDNKKLSKSSAMYLLQRVKDGDFQ